MSGSSRAPRIRLSPGRVAFPLCYRLQMAFQAFLKAGTRARIFCWRRATDHWRRDLDGCGPRDDRSESAAYEPGGVVAMLVALIGPTHRLVRSWRFLFRQAHSRSPA